MQTISQKSTTKAYVINDDDAWTIGFAKTPGKAKAAAMKETGGEFTYMNARRAPWLDEYGRRENIPASALIYNGWWMECAHCGSKIDNDALDEVGKTPDGVIGMYTGAVYCDQVCKEKSDELEYKKSGIRNILRQEWEARINQRFGGDVEIMNSHFQVTDDLCVGSVWVRVRFYFQLEGRTSIFESTRHDALRLEDALEEKLAARIPRGDRKAARNYFYEKEGIYID